MDFTTRNAQPRMGAPARVGMQAPQQTSGTTPPRSGGEDKKPKRFGHRWFQISSVILLFSGTILVIAVLLFINLGNPSREDKYVNTSEYQAVVINDTVTDSNQGYYGHITDMTDKYIHLTNVFYIQQATSGTSSSSGTNAYNLIKLGCELYAPEDAMTINRDQVLYWENLKPSGQVTQKINDWYKQNPNGQNCSNSTSNNSTQQGGTSATGSSSGTSSNSTTSTNTDTSTSKTPTTSGSTDTTPSTTTKKP